MSSSNIVSMTGGPGEPRFGRYEFVVLSSLRAHQLMSGSTPRMPGSHKATTIACMEVAAGHIESLPHLAPVAASAPLEDSIGIPVLSP